MTSLVFQINAMVIASGNKAKNVSNQKTETIKPGKNRAEFHGQARIVEQKSHTHLQKIKGQRAASG